MAVNINIPSQVKTYANLAAFPATGALKTIYIAEDTNKTYRWTGSIYTEISASAAMTWGAIGGTLSNQTDLQSALDAKVPTSRTLTINGVTQDLTANRTFTISTGITIGTTAIASGTVGRILFEGAGNVVQESSSLSYDDTTKVFTLSGPIGSVIQHTSLTNYIGFGGFQLNVSGGLERAFAKLNPDSGEFKIGTTGSGYFTTIHTGGVERLRVFSSTGNVSIGTTTDAGFKLDVNGTARVSGLLSTPAGVNLGGWYLYANGTSLANIYGGTNWIYTVSAGGSHRFLGGNLLINTTTDAGFRLDVNGTVRVADNNQLGWGNGNYFIANNATPKIDCYVQSSLILTLGQSTMTFGVAARTRDLTASSDATFDFGGQFNRYRHGWLSGQLKVGDATAVNASAKVQIDSTTQGFLPPRMTTTQRNAIASPAAGLMVYDTTLNVISYYNGTMWI